MFQKLQITEKYGYIISGFLIVTANVLYYLGLEYCDVGETLKCAEMMQGIIYKLVAEVIVSSLIFGMLSLFYFQKRKYKIPVICLINLMVWYLTNHSLDLDYQMIHGFINMIVSISVTFAVFAIYYVIIALIKIFKSQYAFTISFIILTTLYLGSFIVAESFTCRDWIKGFKLTSIDNSVSCSVSAPFMCVGSATYGGLKDLTKLLGLSCNTEFRYSKKVSTFYKNSDLVFFPDTRKFSAEERETRVFYDFLVNGLVFVNFTDPNYFINNEINGVKLTDKQKIIDFYQIKGYEIGVDLTGHNPKLIQKVIRNETLVQQAKLRKSLYEERNKNEMSNDITPISKNVMFFFFDSLSRPAFKQVLSKTYGLLEKFYESNSDMESFQFFKYNTVCPNTFRSGFAALFGVNTFDINNEETTRENIYDVFRSKGYINTYSASTCSPIVMWYEKEHVKYLNYTKFSPFDHENFSLMCDPTFTQDVKKGVYPIDNGVFLPYIRCLYGKNSYEYVLDYATQSMSVYKDVSQFQLAYFSDAHESSNEAAKYLDKPLYQFIVKHIDQFINDDWTLIFYTDHGIHFGSISPDFFH